MTERIGLTRMGLVFAFALVLTLGQFAGAGEPASGSSRFSAATDDTLINVVQWSAAAGGNDHWYGIIPIVQWWTDHMELAPMLDVEGSPGYLATITSAEEDDFILYSVLDGVMPDGNYDEYLLGGNVFSGSWEWITGEAFVYQNWGAGEPSNHEFETVLAMWGVDWPEHTEGKWNDVGTQPDPVGPEHALYAIVEFGEFEVDPPPPPPPPDTLVGLVKWDAASGGNDHWYGIIPIVQWWTDHMELAPMLDVEGSPGYLATITSAEEDDFILNGVLAGNMPDGNYDEYLLGGHIFSGSWEWITGEPYGYENWGDGEPNGVDVETVIAKWGVDWPPEKAGKWNNVGTDPDLVGNTHQLYAIVEFGEFEVDPPPPPPDTLVGLVKWDAVAGGNDHWYGIIPIVQWWTDHMELAPMLDVEGMPGYLATVTTAEEDYFILHTVLEGTMPVGNHDEYLLGGHIFSGSWEWITGEEYVYENWGAGEPNNEDVETVIAKWGVEWSPDKAGKWNNVGTDPDLVGNTHQLYAIVEFGEFEVDPPPPPPDTLVGLVKWDAAAGGNDHWYGIIPIVQWWTDHMGLAPMLDVEGMPGYLATITSAEEDNFILHSVLEGTMPVGNHDEYLLGGHIFSGSWEWITGEPYSYENWGAGEPNNEDEETVIAKWGIDWPPDKAGKWNNVGTDPNQVGPEHQLFAIVEFGAADVSTDSLFFTSTAGPGCTGCGNNAIEQTVACLLSEPASGATISFKIPGGATVCDISFDGHVTASWDFSLVNIKNDSGFAVVSLANTTGQLIPAGVSTLFDVYFSITRPDEGANYFIHWDTALSADPSRQTRFANADFQTFEPRFDYQRDSTEIIIEGAPGDFDGNPGITISDLVYMIDYMFLGGPAPCNINLMDVNGDCHGPDIGDLTFYVGYIFQGGEAPREGCITAGKAREVTASADVVVWSRFDGEATIIEIETGLDLRGLLFELKGAADSEPQLLLDNGMEIIYGVEGDATRISVLDLQGETVMPRGQTAIVRLAGEHELTAALASDLSHHVLVASTAVGATIPTDFALHQNYPNPFNPVTEIGFSLPVGGNVRLDVFNITGQLVTTLVDGVRAPGRYTVQWDASSVASGVYLYRLQTDTFVQSRKMVLLK